MAREWKFYSMGFKMKLLKTKAALVSSQLTKFKLIAIYFLN